MRHQEPDPCRHQQSSGDTRNPAEDVLNDWKIGALQIQCAKRKAHRARDQHEARYSSDSAGRASQFRSHTDRDAEDIRSRKELDKAQPGFLIPGSFSGGDDVRDG
jgi:hypothetical protein